MPESGQAGEMRKQEAGTAARAGYTLGWLYMKLYQKIPSWWCLFSSPVCVFHRMDKNKTVSVSKMHQNCIYLWVMSHSGYTVVVHMLWPYVNDKEETSWKIASSLFPIATSCNIQCGRRMIGAVGRRMFGQGQSEYLQAEDRFKGGTSTLKEVTCHAILKHCRTFCS